MEAVLRLFNAVQVETPSHKKHVDLSIKRTIKHGFVLDPAIELTDDLLKTIASTVGQSGSQLNAAFHKSWKTIQDASLESLVVQQLTHYLTTYGFEAVGIYHPDAVYIPREKLEIPELQADIPLLFIKAMNAQQILAAIIELASGIALSEETLSDIMAIVENNKYDADFVQKIKNRELKIRLCDYYKIVPSEPLEYLRYVISKLTDESLLIKNDELIEKIKNSNGKFLDELLERAPQDLASIFLRYKPIFLAMKSISHNKTFFNRLRKQAVHLHKPLPVDYLNSVTTQIKQNALDLETLKTYLSNATVFRKIRLAYALNHRIHGGASIVYKVRNGRGWATEFDWPNDLGQPTNEALEIVLDSIANSLRPKLEGKTIFIPAGVHYALPATAKQFTGHFPTGSYFSVPEDLIVGIHWKNTKKRVDLDLSVIGKSGKTGWDADYRSDGNKILFSGDMTDAPPPDGATELFYIKSDVGEPKILTVNYYNFAKNDEVRTKLIVARESAKNFGGNYMVDPNNVIACADLNIRKRQNILGLIASVDGENRVYFANVSVGNSITARNNVQATIARNYLFDSLINSIDCRTLLRQAGASVVDERPEKQDFVDLSPIKLDQSTWINLIS